MPLANGISGFQGASLTDDLAHAESKFRAATREYKKNAFGGQKVLGVVHETMIGLVLYEFIRDSARARVH